MTAKILLFTDLDGTLLDHDTYELDAARGTVEALKRVGVSLICNSSKTDVEIREYAEMLGLSEPFLAEGGGVAGFPRGGVLACPEPFVEEDGWRLHLLGRPAAELQAAFGAMRAELDLPLRAAHEMSDGELAAATGLPRGQIPLMRRRRASVPFLFAGAETPGAGARLRSWVEAHGLGYTRGGRFHHLTGPTDKGRAAAFLAALYRKAHPALVTIGAGDGLNDLPLLRWADYAVAVPGKEGLRPELAAVPRVRIAPGPGPAGWKAALDALFGELGVALPGT